MLSIVEDFSLQRMLDDFLQRDARPRQRPGEIALCCETNFNIQFEEDDPIKSRFDDLVSNATIEAYGGRTVHQPWKP